MKNNIFSTLFICFVAFHAVHAQNPGCDGTRYKADVFQAFTKTTVVYAPTIDLQGNAMNLSMDVYEPTGDLIAVRPVVILAHGGSFMFGDRDLMARWCELLAKKGYICASISYRLYPWLSQGFPDSLGIFDTAVKAVGDMRAAVRYFREDAATSNQFHADVDHIYIGGYSAGAVTALHCAYLDTDDNIPVFLQNIINNNGGLEGISGTTSNKTYSSSSKAIVNMSGGLYRSNWIDPTEVPMVSIHGTADQTVPYNSGLAANIAYLEGSSRLHIRANNINLWNSLHTVPGGGHTNIYDNAAYQPHLDTFWLNATTLLESLTCATVGTQALLSWENDWSVSPNPNAGDQLTIRLPIDVQTADLQIMNMAGAQLYQQKNVVDNSQVQMPDLMPGIYLIQITTPENPAKKFAARKLVVE